MIHREGGGIIKNKLSVLAALGAMAVLITASEQALSCCRASLRLCAELIIPSLFPFFILSGLLNQLGLPRLMASLFSGSAERLFAVSGAGMSAFFTGILGGYPMGAAQVCRLYAQGSIGREEAGRLLGFCNNTGPAFFLGAIGTGIFGSVRAGLLLYFIHIFSAVMCGIFLSQGKRAVHAAPAPAEELSFSAAITEVIGQSTLAMLNVCGYIICFGVFTGLLEAGGFLPALSGLISGLCGMEAELISAFIKGLLELGSGVASLRNLPFSPALFSLAAFIPGFGGLAVHFQTLSLLADTDIDCRLLLPGKLLSAIISALLAYIAASGLRI